MATPDFFEESREQSLAKARIVTKYFWAWAKVITASAKTSDRRIAYLDLFAGPGRYTDGTESTPLQVLQTAINDPNFSQTLVSVFNGKDQTHSRELERAIQELPGIEKLKYPPRIHHENVGIEMVKEFEATRFIPTLFFVDPWGYKGLSLKLVNAVLKDWGCDCIFFFNYNRINAGLSNSAVEEHMNALFGKDRADKLRIRLGPMPSDYRELLIVEELCEALGARKGRFVLPFRFRSDQGTRTMHHLIFVSKAFKGYEIDLPPINSTNQN